MEYKRYRPKQKVRWYNEGNGEHKYKPSNRLEVNTIPVIDLAARGDAMVEHVIDMFKVYFQTGKEALVPELHYNKNKELQRIVHKPAIGYCTSVPGFEEYHIVDVIVAKCAEEKPVETTMFITIRAINPKTLEEDRTYVNPDRENAATLYWLIMDSIAKML